MRKCVKCYKKWFFWELLIKIFGRLKRAMRGGDGKSRSLPAHKDETRKVRVEYFSRNTSSPRLDASTIDNAVN